MGGEHLLSGIQSFENAESLCIEILARIEYIMRSYGAYRTLLLGALVVF
jgi:hypothetical protein